MFISLNIVVKYSELGKPKEHIEAKYLSRY